MRHPSADAARVRQTRLSLLRNHAGEELQAAFEDIQLAAAHLKKEDDGVVEHVVGRICVHIKELILTTGEIRKINAAETDNGGRSP